MESIKGVAVSGKKVLLRADLDVPLINGRVADDFRIQTALPTIKYLIKNRAKTIITAHLDRPGGRMVAALRLNPVAENLSRRIKAAHKLDNCVGPEVKEAVDQMAEGDVLLLENLRFNPGETGAVPVFSRQLADLADIYVNDCFATSHRKHASVVGVPKLLPSYAGLRLMEETAILRSTVKKPKRPLLLIIGGAKSETKAPLVKKLSGIADKILLGGTLMFEKSLEGTPHVLFPVDALGVSDIGPQTIKRFKEEIKKAKTLVWNGPLGVTLKPEFEMGTRKIAETLANSSAYTIVGGGDTVAALTRFGLRDKMNFVSTGGGAMLQFLAERTLPGLEALGWKKH